MRTEDWTADWSADWSAEYRRLARGHRHDPHTGPAAQQYGKPAAPPLTLGEVVEAERELGIRFPDEYREYLLLVSAGGGGGGGGGGRGQGQGFNRLWRGPDGWGWWGDRDTNYDLLTTDFPHPDSYAAYDDELGDREPPREDAAAWEAWDDECGVLQERKTAGAVYLQEGGCGFNTLLVVTGPHRGEMWFDARATCDLIVPMSCEGRPATFADWTDRPRKIVTHW
ncbi:SMI1/KNR4 family protein [Streptomyces sp. NPDC048623]|uniref:SMI1/KNR4 family protein n=1 Tax=Streptomyces sp. NPDC048623 TaxID=3155761 RepID=UPI0034161DED